MPSEILSRARLPNDSPACPAIPALKSIIGQSRPGLHCPRSRQTPRQVEPAQPGGVSWRCSRCGNACRPAVRGAIRSAAQFEAHCSLRCSVPIVCPIAPNSVLGPGVQRHPLQSKARGFIGQQHCELYLVVFPWRLGNRRSIHLSYGAMGEILAYFRPYSLVRPHAISGRCRLVGERQSLSMACTIWWGLRRGPLPGQGVTTLPASCLFDPQTMPGCRRQPLGHVFGLWPCLTECKAHSLESRSAPKSTASTQANRTLRRA
jgi:hypothetical protein